MMATSPIKLACDPKRRKLDSNFKRCVICQKFTLKIESKCSDSLQIQNVGSNKPDMIVSKGLKIQDITNKVAEMKEMLANAQGTSKYRG